MKIIAGLLIAITLMCSTAFAGHCGRQNVVNYNSNHYNNVQRIQLLLVHPQVYEVKPIVQVQKIEKVIEVKEVERIRVETPVQLQLQNAMQYVLPIIIREVQNNHHHHHHGY